VKNLPRVVQGHCHRLRQGIPYLPAGPQPGWGARTSSSSGGTMIGGACGTSSSSGTTTVGAGISSSSCGTSSPGRTVTAEPYGTGTSSSSGGTIAVSGCDSETSSSKKRMCFALGTSSSSHIMCIANWSGETNSSQRR
jgi:hypothetical protein